MQSHTRVISPMSKIQNYAYGWTKSLDCRNDVSVNLFATSDLAPVFSTTRRAGSERRSPLKEL